uniref:Retrovirus-related Pol polyprotein from transposon TNT 1-94-like beta-barrel domain-containing protein n=1 Tax=Cajanus cajan TaxID=3821 RepID=A0A151TVC5_CAJCA|nr:hypothetical protein KK1_010242 [Cajanus cajan]
MESQGLWIIDYGASNHISDDDSLFCSIFSSKIPHFTLANGSKVISQGVSQVSHTPSLNLEYVLFVPKFAFNLISISQLTKSLNCFVTFDANSFVIQQCGMGRLIGQGHESRGLYYFGTSPFVSCLTSQSPKLLHDHFGHPNSSKLKKMVHRLSKLQFLE